MDTRIPLLKYERQKNYRHKLQCFFSLVDLIKDKVFHRFWLCLGFYLHSFKLFIGLNFQEK
jgi:hypothetical protein